MKSFKCLSGILFTMLLIGFWCGGSTAVAGNHVDLGQMSIDEITDRLGQEFDSINAGQNSADGRNKHDWYRRPGHFDPNPFEFLLDISIEKVAADPDNGLPEFYKVDGLLFPEIKFELRLPLKKKWNKKFYMAGCGGFCGGVDIFPITQFTNNLN